MDGNARRAHPGLSEEERYKQALILMEGQGVQDITEEEMMWALNTAFMAHVKIAERFTGARTIITHEGASRANKIVTNVLDIFLRRR